MENLINHDMVNMCGTNTHCVSVCVCVFSSRELIRGGINRQISCSEMDERADCSEADEVA